MKSNRTNDMTKITFLLVVLWFLVGYVLLPIVNVYVQVFIDQSSNFSFDIMGKYLSNPKNITIIANTIKLALCTVLVCAIIGTLLAFYINYRCNKSKMFKHLILLSPMMVPSVIIVVAFVQIYGQTGLIYSILREVFKIQIPAYNFGGFYGIMLVHACTIYIYYYMNIYIALQYVDNSQLEAAKSLGASKFLLFKDIIFPNIKYAFIRSTFMTFIIGIASFAAPSLIGQGFRVLSTQIATSKANFKFVEASAQSIVLFTIGLIALIITQILSKNTKSHASVRAVPFSVKNHNLPAKTSRIENIMVFIMMGLIIFPILGITYLSFNTTHAIMADPLPHDFSLVNYLSVFTKRRAYKPYINSALIAVFIAFFGSLITLPLAYYKSRTKTKLVMIEDFLVNLPFAIPASVLAINLIITFNQPSIFAFGKVLNGGFYLLPIAHLIASLPILMSSNSVAMNSINKTIEDASRGLGAGRFKTFKSVVLPSVLPAIISGTIVVMTRSISEYTVASLIYSARNKPISIAMFDAFRESSKIGFSLAYAVSIVFVCSALFVVVIKLDKKH